MGDARRCYRALVAFALRSPAFGDGEEIPRRYTADGLDHSVPLAWEAPPEGTRAYALVMVDPDAPGGQFVHWVLYDLPSLERDLHEHVVLAHHLPCGAKQGRNDFGRIGYGGPDPPPGGVHRYVATLFALRERLALGSGARWADVERALGGAVLGQASLVGCYGRGRR